MLEGPPRSGVDGVATGGVAHAQLPMQHALLATVQGVEQHVRLLLEVVRKAPERPNNGEGGKHTLHGATVGDF